MFPVVSPLSCNSKLQNFITLEFIHNVSAFTCVCECECTHTCVYMCSHAIAWEWRSENNLQPVGIGCES